jgi:regulator of replication initiation timing
MKGATLLGKCFPVTVCLGLVFAGASTLRADDDKKDSGGSLGDLFNKVKDLKVPDSVATLPAQLTELKDAYLKTAETVEQLRGEVDRLSEEVAALKEDNFELRKALDDKRVRDDLTKAAEVTSQELLEAFDGDRTAAEGQWKGRYVKVTGPVAKIESGTQELFIFLRGTGEGALVRCEINRDANFHVDVLAAQGRVVSRNDRSTVLAVGQPITVIGTCNGSDLNVVVENGKVEGINVVKKAENDKKKKK